MGELTDDGKQNRAQPETAAAGNVALHRVLDALPYEVVIRDRDSRILYANRAFAASYQSTTDKLIGTRDEENWTRFSRPAEDIANWLAEDREVIEEGQTKDYVQEIQRPDGEVVYFHNVKLPFRLADGSVAVMALYHEVTEQLRRDEELRLAQAAAAELEGIHKTTVTYAHEVNNPLTAILANTQILLDNEDLGFADYPADMSEMLHDINSAAIRIRDVIHKLENLHNAKTKPYLEHDALIDLDAEDELDERQL